MTMVTAVIAVTNITLIIMLRYYSYATNNHGAAATNES